MRRSASLHWAFCRVAQAERAVRPPGTSDRERDTAAANSLFAPEPLSEAIATRVDRDYAPPMSKIAKAGARQVAGSVVRLAMAEWSWSEGSGDENVAPAGPFTVEPQDHTCRLTGG